MISPETLIRKYNKPGPRYTSYPTALQFEPVSNPDDLLAESMRNQGPLSLYFHLPFCESLCWFCACTTVITCNRDKADPYVEALEKEMDLLLERIHPGRPYEQLHFGGGSPSFLTEPQLERLCNAIAQRFPRTEDAEVSAELDPRTLTKDKVEVLANAGFNRVSFGVQDVDPKVQKAVHRFQPDNLNRQCIQWIRESGISALNVDLIYGLPYQTVESFRKTIDTILEYDPDRLAVFSYAHVPWVAPAQKILEKSTLPDPETKLAMLIMTIERLTEAGYVYIGMDHFAKKGDGLLKAMEQGDMHRNFQGYTTHSGRELCSFGMSSIAQTSDAYRQNFKELDSWYAAIQEDRLPIEKGYVLTEDDKLRREVIMNIMCSGKVRYETFANRYQIDFTDYFQEALSQLSELAEDELVEFHQDGFDVTENGRLLLRNIAMPFDAYYQAKSNRHAKTI